MRKWTKETAERMLKDNLVPDNKTIYFNGDATLGKCSAADYLTNHCGYITMADLKDKGEK